jgi:hypothetical protein
MLTRLALHLREASQRLLDFSKHGLKRILLDARIAAEWCEGLTLPLEFLHQVRLQIRAAGDFRDLEQRDERDMMFPRIFLSQKERKALEQVFEAQKRSDSLVEGILVKNQAGSPRTWSVTELQDILMP